MNHPDAETLLRFAEGDVVPPLVTQHVSACASCQHSLADLGWIETRVANSSELSAEERERLRAVTRQVLTANGLRAASGRASAARWFWWTLPLAAVLLAMLCYWPSSDGLLETTIRRYRPDHIVRAEQLDRFFVDVQFGKPRWIALWQLDTTGPRQLVPHHDPLLRWLGATMPLAAGTHRVPAAEVLDFEFSVAKPPTGLFLVAHERELTDAELAAIAAMLRDTPRAELLATARAKWPECRLIDFGAQ